MQNSGTLTEMPLEGILETIQKDRATGTLHMSGSKGDATLFFLFGHLFHAVDAERQGEPVVYDALDWNEGDFTFDSKAKLPAEETIKVSTADLMAQRATGSGAAAPVNESEAEAASEARDVLAEAGDLGVSEPDGDGQEPTSDVAEAPTEADVAVPEPAPEPESAPSPQPAAAAQKADLPGPEPNRPGAPKRRRTDVRPGTRPPETMELYPVPLGELIYQSLTAAFVDFPKLLRSLAKDQHFGYVRLNGEDFHAVLLFSSGAVVEAIYDGHGEVHTGVDAFRRFGKDIDNSEGNLDVIALTPEMVTAIYQLLTAPSLYEKLTARFIRADELFTHLSEEGISGAAVVRVGRQTGIVLYRDGALLGCYTDSAPALEVDPAKVLAICTDPAAQIEVRGGPVPDALPVLESGQAGPSSVPSGSGGTVPTARPAEAAVAEAATPSLPEAAPEPQAAIETEAVAAPGYATSANGVDAAEGDWGTLISAMAGRADAVLGTRSKKVKELLYSAGHTREDVETTIDRIAELSIMFVDPSKLTSLAADMREIAASAH